MDDISIRLECLKLVHRHDRSPDDIVVHAERYEKYVVGKEVSRETVNTSIPSAKRRGRPPRQP